MKYSLETELALPRAEVVRLFDSTENLYKWQPELITFDHMSGEPGQVGAKSKLKYKMGNREIEMVETVTRRNLPDEFAGTYEAKGVWNEVVNRFAEIGSDRTKWTIDTEFRCGGIIMKLMALLMPGAFKKQTWKFMEQFKEFAESEYGRG